MHEFDLIPEGYRNTKRMRRWLVRFAVAYGIAVAGLLGAKQMIALEIGRETLTIEQLRLDKNTLLQRQLQLEQLGAQHEALTKKLAVLRSLRTGPTMTEIFRMVDRSLARQIWFREWRYSQAGEFVPETETEDRGARLIVVSNEDVAGGKRAWRMKTHMEIRGDASTHSSLADFVGRLGAQPMIHEVKILNTQASGAEAARSVGFELAIVVRGGEDT